MLLGHSSTHLVGWPSICDSFHGQDVREKTTAIYPNVELSSVPSLRCLNCFAMRSLQAGLPGAAPDSHDEEGLTPLVSAVAANKLGVAAYLLGR